MIYFTSKPCFFLLFNGVRFVKLVLFISFMLWNGSLMEYEGEMRIYVTIDLNEIFHTL